MSEKAYKEVIERQNRKLSILYDIAITVSKSLNLKEILSSALDRVIEFMGVDSGVIYVINEENLEMLPVVFRNLSDEVVEDLTRNRVRVGECMCGNIAQFNREVIINEKASEDRRFTRETLKREGMEFYAGIPLYIRGRVVGVLCAITHKPYRSKPDDIEILLAASVPIALAIENARMYESLREEIERMGQVSDFSNIVTNSPKMLRVLDLVRKVLNVPTSILLCGESGTGKELIARAIHYNSTRKEGPFIPVNCAAIPDSLLESELFGYVKGAFTGASGEKKGLFEAADGGTLFLDEINSMSESLQSKLLRFLQDRQFFKVGSTTPISVDVRVLAATNQDLDRAVKESRFRKDLFYRLNTMKISLPPLRERIEDIPLLARYFIERLNVRLRRNIKGITAGALRTLSLYEWPGNVRELENAIEHAMIMTEGEYITFEDLPESVRPDRESPDDISLETIERRHILNVLKMTGGEKKKAAELLGINPVTLWRKLKAYGLNGIT
jgi:transcriptional regulator with GAF, ATPase, and Fis domain